MANTSDHWRKQTPEAPLFPDMLWSRPETKKTAGKLLIIGGNSHAFNTPAQAYTEAEKAGIGTARVLLPDSLQKTVGRVFPAGEYAPSTPSGSFSQQALSELLDMSTWPDAVLLAGDFGHNAETAVLLEQFTQKYTGQLTLTHDSLDYFLSNASNLAIRPNTLLVPNFSQLQKLATAVRLDTALTSGMDFLHFIDALHDFTKKHPVAIAIKHLETDFVAVGGEVSSTKPPNASNEVAMATQAAVWWLQNPAKTFEAISCAMIVADQ